MKAGKGVDEAKEMKDQAEHEKERKEGSLGLVEFLGKVIRKGVREWGGGAAQ